MAWGRGIFTLVKGLAESDPTVGLGFNRDCPQRGLRPPSPALKLPRAGLAFSPWGESPHRCLLASPLLRSPSPLNSETFFRSPSLCFP